MIWRRIGLLTGLSLLLAACGQVGETYTLEDGNTLSGDQHIAAFEVVIEPNSQIDGDLNITASDVVLQGEINGDVTVVASDLVIGEQAQINGNLLYCATRNGKFEQSAQAVITGTIENSCERNGAFTRERRISPLAWLLGLVVLPLGAGLTGSLSTILLPTQTSRISLIAHEQRFKALALGGFTLLVAAGLTALYLFSMVLVIPVVLAPLVIIGWLLLGITTLIGAVALARPLGVWLLRLVGMQDAPPMLPAMVGVAVLLFGLLLLAAITPLGWLLIGILAAWSLGAVLLTYPVSGRNWQARNFFRKGV